MRAPAQLQRPKREAWLLDADWTRKRSGSKLDGKNLKDEVEKHDDYEGNTQQPHNDRGHLEDSI